MAKVWKCTLDDADRIMSIASRVNDRFHAEPLDVDKIEYNICHLIEHAVSFCSEGGFISGLVHDDLFRDCTYLTSVVWYCEDRQGLRLLNNFIRAGEELGVDDVRVCTTLLSGTVANKLLIKKGFVAHDTVYSTKI